MTTLLQPQVIEIDQPGWPIFEIPVDRVLEFLHHKTGEKISTLSLHKLLPKASASCPDWRLALNVGLHQRLHLNLGIPGIETPDQPIEENAVALYTALLLGWDSLPVILSGELDIAVEEGLIPPGSLEQIRKWAQR